MQLIYVLMELPTTREKYAFRNTHQLKIRFHGAVFFITYSQNSQLTRLRALVGRMGFEPILYGF